jgi:hypothetical protein
MLDRNITPDFKNHLENDLVKLNMILAKKFLCCPLIRISRELLMTNNFVSSILVLLKSGTSKVRNKVINDILFNILNLSGGFLFVDNVKIYFLLPFNIFEYAIEEGCLE